MIDIIAIATLLFENTHSAISIIFYLSISEMSHAFPYVGDLLCFCKVFMYSGAPAVRRNYEQRSRHTRFFDAAGGALSDLRVLLFALSASRR